MRALHSGDDRRETFDILRAADFVFSIVSNRTREQMQRRRLVFTCERRDFDSFHRFVFHPFFAARQKHFVFFQMKRTGFALQSPIAVPRGASPARRPIAGIGKRNVAVESEKRL